jgi:hypothetical protein
MSSIAILQPLPGHASAGLLNNRPKLTYNAGTMAATIRKPSVGGLVLTPPMLLFGFLMFLYGHFELVEWRSEPSVLIACGVVWILTGLGVIGSALWLALLLGRSPLALRLGGAAILVSGTVLATAAGTGALPCTGPG